MLKKLVYVLAAVLVGVVVFDFVRGQNDDTSAEEGQRRYEHLAAAGAKLREAGTAQVTFTANLRTDVGTGKVSWAGTSALQFGPDDETKSDTTYSAITIRDDKPVQVRRVDDGGDTYYESAGFVTADRRPWMDADVTTMFWADPLADPELRLTDYPMWQAFLDDVQRDNAIGGYTEDLRDIDGAVHEYDVTCTPGDDAGCPPPFRTVADQYFNHVALIRWFVWLDAEDRPLRVEVSTEMRWDPDRPGRDTGIQHQRNMYAFQAAFDFTGFGDPVTVTTPPEKEVSQVKVALQRK